MEHVEAAQSSSLHGMDVRHTRSNAMLLMNLRHIVETHGGQLLHVSGNVLLVVASSFHCFMACYTLKKLRHLIRRDLRD